MNNGNDAKFDGWAVVEMMGHQREIGYVTTEYFGGAAMFRIDSPEIPEHEFELTRPEWIDDGQQSLLAAAGSRVKRQGRPAKTRLVSPGALYAITPCTEETAREAIEDMFHRPLIAVDIKTEARPALLPGEPDDEFKFDDSSEAVPGEELREVSE